MLTKEQIKQIAFSQYPALIEVVKNKHANLLTRYGVPYEEIVNEAIIGVMDIEVFPSESELIEFLNKAVINISWAEKEQLKDTNFSTQKSQFKDETYDISEIKKPTFIDTPSDEFIKIYSLFERWRYKKYDGQVKCHKCGSLSIYYFNPQDGRQAFASCKLCKIPISITARTYIHKRRLEFKQIYKAVTLILKDKKIYTSHLAKRIKVAWKTAQIKKNLVLSVIENIDSDRRHRVLEKILTAVPQDEAPVEIINFYRRLKPEDVLLFRRLYHDKVYKIKELAEMYNVDRSQMRKIVKGEYWKNLPMPIAS